MLNDKFVKEADGVFGNIEEYRTAMKNYALLGLDPNSNAALRKGREAAEAAHIDVYGSKKAAH